MLQELRVPIKLNNKKDYLLKKGYFDVRFLTYTYFKRLKEEPLTLSKNNGLILEIGCGSGIFINKVNNVIGVDINLSTLKNIKRDKPGQLLVQADARHLPFKNDSFCFIASFLMLEHINEPGAVFDEIFPLATELKVRFQLPHSDNIINASIKVIRIEASAELEKVDIGTCFSFISDKDREEIKQLIERIDINNLLALTIKKGASDLHLLVNQSPVIRVNGELEALDIKPFSPEEISQLLRSLMTKQQIRIFEREKEVDWNSI